ncbi:hypothetical protein EV562_10944 [Streptomyces sp. BK208]|nr:hypothetical protein EV562_10944 [Streptomyces sp. BK208]
MSGSIAEASGNPGAEAWGQPGTVGAGEPGPALARISAVKGPLPDAAVTSETCPVSAHRTNRVRWARATRSALSHAAVPPSAQWSAAASAAKSAPPAAR